jgi:CO/xanthine dehydrogenase Mo-binding subunit
MAACWYGIARTATVDRAAAWAEIDDGGSAKIVTGVTEIGEGILTALAQIAAHEIGVKPEHVVIGDNDTARAPEAAHAGASRQTYMIGNVVALASREARQRLVDVMAGMWDAPAETIRTGNGEIWAENTNHRITMGEAVACAKNRGVVPIGSATFGTNTTGIADGKGGDGSGRPWQAYVFGCQVAEVEVDTITGEVQVLAVWAAHDVGRAVNRAGARTGADGGLSAQGRPHLDAGFCQIHSANVARRTARQLDHHRGPRSDRPARRQGHWRAGDGADHSRRDERDLRCYRRAHLRSAGLAGKNPAGAAREGEKRSSQD